MTTVQQHPFRRRGCPLSAHALGRAGVSGAPGSRQIATQLRQEVVVGTTFDEMLTARVGELLNGRGQAQILSTTGTQAAINSLSERMAVVEEAIRQVTAAVEQLSALKPPC